MSQLSYVKQMINEMNTRIWQQRDADALLDYFDRDVVFSGNENQMSLDQIYDYVVRSQLRGVTTRISPQPRVVMQGDGSVLSWAKYRMYDGDGALIQTLDGMNRYVLQGDKIVENHFMWSDDLRHVMQRTVLGGDSTVSAGDVGIRQLSLRELQCFYGLVQGETSKRIAQRLYLSSRTVEEHIARLKSKLGMKTLDQLMNYARANELLQVSPILQNLLQEAV